MAEAKVGKFLIGSNAYLSIFGNNGFFLGVSATTVNAYVVSWFS